MYSRLVPAFLASIVASSLLLAGCAVEADPGSPQGVDAPPAATTEQAGSMDAPATVGHVLPPGSSLPAQPGEDVASTRTREPSLDAHPSFMFQNLGLRVEPRARFEHPEIVGMPEHPIGPGPK